MLREQGWKLAEQKEYRQAIKKFMLSALKSDEKYIDYREMGWMYRELEDYDKSQDCFEKAFNINDKDYYTVKGYLSLNVFLKNKEKISALSKHALSLFPEDEIIKKLSKKSLFSLFS